MKVMDSEFKALKSNNTWHLVSPKKRVNVIDCKWVYESASRPPCGFWRIDEQQLEFKPCVASFVEHHVEKGNMNRL
jgi:hypothetical protein